MKKGDIQSEKYNGKEKNRSVNVPRHSCAKTQQNSGRVFLSAAKRFRSRFQNFPHRDDFSYNKLDLKSAGEGKGAKFSTKNHPPHIRPPIYYIFRLFIHFSGVPSAASKIITYKMPARVVSPRIYWSPMSGLFSRALYRPSTKGLFMGPHRRGEAVSGPRDPFGFPSFRRRQVPPLVAGKLGNSGNFPAPSVTIVALGSRVQFSESNPRHYLGDALVPSNIHSFGLTIKRKKSRK